LHHGNKSQLKLEVVGFYVGLNDTGGDAFGPLG